MNMPRQHVLFTLGTSARSIADFIAILKSRNVETVADVRRFPTSRFEHFRAENLAVSLKEEGIMYVSMGKELGAFRNGGYESFAATAEFQEGIESLERLAEEKTAAVICAERLPWQCHRRFIALRLQERGWTVRHIIDMENECLPQQGMEIQ